MAFRFGSWRSFGGYSPKFYCAALSINRTANTITKGMNLVEFLLYLFTLLGNQTIFGVDYFEDVLHGQNTIIFFLYISSWDLSAKFIIIYSRYGCVVDSEVLAKIIIFLRF